MAENDSPNPADVVCPESTIESANRRDFIRKAALVAAVTGVGATAIGQNLLPKVAAKADGIKSFCNPVIITPLCSCPGVINALDVVLPNKNSTCCGFSSAIFAYTCACSTPVEPPSGPSAVVGSAISGNGVVGISGDGPAIWGIASGPDAIPILAQGACGQVRPLQEWQTFCGKLSALGPDGTLALGTFSTQGYELRVCAPNQNGIQLRGPSTGDGAGFVFQTICPSGGEGQGWQILDTGSRAGPGPNKLNIRNLNSSNDVLTIEGSNVGINATAPNTTLRINGSVSGKVVVEKNNYVMGPSDFTVFGNATSGAITVTLPSASTQEGMIVFIKKTDSSVNAVTIAGAGTDKIEGVPNKTLSKAYDGLQLISNGSNTWLIVGNSLGGAFTS